MRWLETLIDVALKAGGAVLALLFRWLRKEEKRKKGREEKRREEDTTVHHNHKNTGEINKNNLD